jgi:hypothetical protein
VVPSTPSGRHRWSCRLAAAAGAGGRRQSVQEVPEVVRRPRGPWGRQPEGTPVQLLAHALHLLGDAGGCVRYGAHRRGDGASAHRGSLSALGTPQGCWLMITGVVTWTLAELGGPGAAATQPRAGSRGVMDEWQLEEHKRRSGRTNTRRTQREGGCGATRESHRGAAYSRWKDMVRQTGSALPTVWRSFQATTSQSA